MTRSVYNFFQVFLAMSRFLLFKYSLPILFFLIASSSFSQITGSGIIRISLREDLRYQTIDHFGASDAWSIQFVGNWPQQKKERIADLLFSQKMENGKPTGIGLSMWRFNLGGGSAEQGFGSGIRDEWRRAESFLDADLNLDMSKASGQVWFAKAAKNRGVDKLLLFSNSPPVAFTRNGKTFSSDGSSNLAKGMNRSFADYISSVFLGFSQLELYPKYISPINEPQWDWSDGGQEGSPYLNSEISEFVKVLNQSFEEHGVKAKIDVAEAGKINYLFEKADKPNRGEQIKTFFDESSPFYLGDLSHISKVISGHSYFTTSPIDSSIKLRKRLSREISLFSGLEYWMSEYCILGDNNGEINGNGRDLGISSALYLARVIHQDLTISNASAWSWWLAVSPYNYKDGLIYIDKNKEGGKIYESKMLWTLGNYSRFIRPGYQRVGVETPNYNSSDFLVSAFRNPRNGDIVLVLVNSNSKPQNLLIDDFSIQDSRLTGYLTSEKSDLQLVEMDPDNLQIPANSILTLLLTKK